MTNEEINIAVARKLGWKLIKSDSERCVYPERWYPPNMDSTKSMNYSGSIEAAWEIVEHLSKNGIGTYLFGGITDSWHCDLHTHPAGNDDPMVSESADTAPRAICESFLKLPLPSGVKEA